MQGKIVMKLYSYISFFVGVGGGGGSVHEQSMSFVSSSDGVVVHRKCKLTLVPGTNDFALSIWKGHSESFLSIPKHEV